ncbi:MAG TPA: hypothetical protein VHE30_00260 [Polyangiaceae bacterium]|nr:hypothetical protein [Polyangiaceae bacterium]
MASTANGSPPNGHGGTDEQDPDAAHAEEPSLGDAPIAILELAESCRGFVRGALQVELDYEVETLPVLDEYVRLARTGVEDRPETEPLVAAAVAAYFGEVVRRRIEGFWRRSPTVPDEWQLCARRAFLLMSPLGMVYEALHRGEDHSGPSAELDLAPSDRALAEARLAVFPEVSEEDYYLLSTRLEVVEVIYEALRDRMRDEGRESVVFEEEDYADE